MTQTIYLIITTSLLSSNKYERYHQYVNGITQAIHLFQSIPFIQIIIVENTGKSSSFLDTFGIPVLYTTTNLQLNTNKGAKEIIDILHVIEHFQLQDHDFIIKLTGRYLLHEDSPFLHIIKQFPIQTYDAILKYGEYHQSTIHSDTYFSCITGLIGMKVYYIKQIQLPVDQECIEWKWAGIANSIPKDRICILPHLGLTQFISEDPSRTFPA